MSAIYISIEKNSKIFGLYKKLWSSRGVNGIRANTMTEGIEAAIAIEKSKTQYLYFVDIVADEINFMPQLEILNRQIDAPVLIATSKYDEDEHHKALNAGAHFYGKYCSDPKKNINAVIAVINSYHRAKRHKSETDVLAHGGILISVSQRRTFINDLEVELTVHEFDMLHCFMDNHGRILSNKEIYGHVWGEMYNDSSNEVIKGVIKRLRKKIDRRERESSIIENVRGYGYRMGI